VNVAACSLSQENTACVVNGCDAGYNSNEKSGSIVCDIMGGVDGALSYSGELFCTPARCTPGDSGIAGTVVCDAVGGTVGGTTGSCSCDCNSGYEGNDCATCAAGYGGDNCEDIDECAAGNDAVCGAGGTCTQTNDGSGQTVDAYYCACADGYAEGGEKTKCADHPDQRTIETVYQIGGLGEEFYNENTPAVKAAMRQATATVTGVVLSAVTVTKMEYVAPAVAARRVLADGTGVISATCHIAYLASEQGETIISALLETGESSDGFVDAFVEAFEAETGELLDTSTITVEDVSAAEADGLDSSADGSSDGGMDVTIVVIIVCAAAVVLVIIVLVAFGMTRNSETGKGTGTFNDDYDFSSPTHQHQSLVESEAHAPHAL